MDLQTSVPSLSSAPPPLADRSPSSHDRVVWTGIAGYYAPYVLAGALGALFALTARFPALWWIWLLCQAGSVGIIYGVTLRREERARVWLPALAICVLGQLHFLVLNGALMRMLDALVVSFGIAAQLRGMVRSYALPASYVAPFQSVIAIFLAALSVYTVVAVAGAAVMLLQFPLSGAVGAIFLVTLLMTGYAMAYAPHPQALKTAASWLIAGMVAELAAVLLFLPTLPFVAAALALSLYAPCLERARASLALPSRRIIMGGGSAIAAVWVVVLLTARWP